MGEDLGGETQYHWNYTIKLQWDQNGEPFNNLRYAVDIVLMTDKKNEVQRMMEDLNTETSKTDIEVYIKVIVMYT